MLYIYIYICGTPPPCDLPHRFIWLCLHACAPVRARARACVHACVRAYVFVCAHASGCIRACVWVCMCIFEHGDREYK